MGGDHCDNSVDEGLQADLVVTEKYILSIGDNYEHIVVNVEQLLCDAVGNEEYNSLEFSKFQLLLIKDSKTKLCPSCKDKYTKLSTHLNFCN